MAKRRLGRVWLRLLVRQLLLLLFPGTSTQRWDYHLCQWSKEGQVCGLRAKVHVCRCGAFSVSRFGPRFGPRFFPLSSCSIQTRKRACFAFLFVGVNSIHEKRPVGNRRSNGIRSKTNRTMIVWSRLVKASVSNGERGFARSVPGQGSWRAFWLGIAVKRKHCKDLGVWV